MSVDVDTPTRPTAPATKRRAEVAPAAPGPVLTKIYDWAALNAQPPMFMTVVRKPSVDELKKPPTWAMARHLVGYLVNALLSLAALLLFLVVWLVCHIVLWLIGHPKRFAAGLIVAVGVAIYLANR